MKIKDFGEKVRLEICNLLYQKIEEKEFDTLHDAWNYASLKVDKCFLKFYVRRDKNPKKQHLLRINPYPKTGGYILQPDWDTARIVNDVSQLYEEMSDLVITREDVE